jgi:hypothetical protein
VWARLGAAGALAGLARALARAGARARPGPRRGAGARQGLTLVHISAQLERILWDRGAFRGSC